MISTKKIKCPKITKKLIRRLSKAWTEHIKQFKPKHVDAVKHSINKTVKNKTMGSFYGSRQLKTLFISMDKLSKIEFILYCAAMYRVARRYERSK